LVIFIGVGFVRCLFRFWGVFFFFFFLRE